MSPVENGHLMHRWRRPELNVVATAEADRWICLYAWVLNINDPSLQIASRFWADLITAFVPPGYQLGVLVCGGQEERHDWPELDQVLAPRLAIEDVLPACRDRDFLEHLTFLISAYDTESLGTLALSAYQGQSTVLEELRAFFYGDLRFEHEDDALSFLKKFHSLLYSTVDDPYLWIMTATVPSEEVYALLREVALRHGLHLKIEQSQPTPPPLHTLLQWHQPPCS